MHHFELAFHCLVRRVQFDEKISFAYGREVEVLYIAWVFSLNTLVDYRGVGYFL